MKKFPLKKDAIISPQRYEEMYQQSCGDPEGFWGRLGEELLEWHKKWHRVKDTSFTKDVVNIKWFEGAMLNVAYNCLDRHLQSFPDRIALYFEPDEPGQGGVTYSYLELHTQVCKAANMLISLGVKAGDRVTIYMPMIPEAVIAMLAVARIGAVHSVVFGGFSASALAARIKDSDSRIVITADQSVRAGKNIDLKASVDKALEGVLVDKVVVVKRTGSNVNWVQGRDCWWHELLAKESSRHDAQAFDSEHPLFILYTSGSTGQPKGLLHTSGGYLLYAAATFKYVFDYRPGEVYWCTADVGWITGHSYIVYGPLAVGASIVIHEGVPNYPDASRIWQIVDKYKVNQLYTSPTAIRMLMREGDSYLQSTSRLSLKTLGSVGEPINPEAWLWYYEKVGNGRATVVDTWWQTETGGHMIAPLPGAVAAVPSSATKPFFGVQPVVLDANTAKKLAPTQEGALCIADSWPGQARTIWGDHERFIQTYFSSYDGYYFSGDAAKCDEDGYYWIIGRMDDVVNVSGHRIGTAEVEAAINSSPLVAESAVVGYGHEVKGQAIYAFVILNTLEANVDHSELIASIRAKVRVMIGALAVPEIIQFVDGLPKTRSGKIMRRILRKIANNEVVTEADVPKLGDISTLLDPKVVLEIIRGKVNK